MSAENSHDGYDDQDRSSAAVEHKEATADIAFLASVRLSAPRPQECRDPEGRGEEQQPEHHRCQRGASYGEEEGQEDERRQCEGDVGNDDRHRAVGRGLTLAVVPLDEDHGAAKGSHHQHEERKDTHDG